MDALGLHISKQIKTNCPLLKVIEDCGISSQDLMARFIYKLM